MLWRLNIVERVILVAGGMLMFIPGTVTDLAGLAIVVLMIVINAKKWKRVKVA